MCVESDKLFAVFEQELNLPGISGKWRTYTTLHSRDKAQELAQQSGQILVGIYGEEEARRVCDEVNDQTLKTANVQVLEMFAMSMEEVITRELNLFS